MSTSTAEHNFTLVFRDEVGDLMRCSCGFQEFDFNEGKTAFKKHLEDLKVKAADKARQKADGWSCPEWLGRLMSQNFFQLAYISIGVF